MASIYDLKPAFQNLLRPSSNWLATHRISPNQVTIAAVVISLLTGITISIFPHSAWPLFLVPFILLFRMILNAIDGMLAREHNMQTALGTFLNEIGDVLSDTFLYLPFSLVPGISAPVIVFIVILAIISEMTGVVAIQVGAKRHYEGPMGKSDRAAVFGAIGLLLGLGFKAALWLNVIFVIVALLLVVTIINRISKSLREIRHDT